MVASLLKIISSGIQDERLTFKHTLYPFKKIWIRAGRFTTKWGRLDFENTPTFGNTAFFRLLRQGHLISRLFLVANMPDIYSTQREAQIANHGEKAYPRFGWTNSLGHALIQQLTLDIAAARVETISSRLLEILDEFNTPLEKVPVINDLIKRKDHGFTETSFGWPPPASSPSVRPYNEQVVVPLPFWFTRGDPGCYFPIDAVTFDEVRVGITFNSLNGLYYTGTQLSSNTSTEPGTSLWPLANTNFYAEDPVQNPGQQPLSNNKGVIQMPNLQLGECYIMAEYVYLDQNEANRFRLADLQIPIVQHYSMNPFDTRGLPTARIPLYVPNPTRDIFFMLNRVEAPSYNQYFLATRDLTGNINTSPNDEQFPWQPDALGLYAQNPSLFLRPGFELSDSEPLSGYELDYEGTLVRFRTQGPALFRSILPSYEQRKSPWIWRYYYNMPLGIQNGYTPFSRPQGEANLDKIVNRDLVLQIRPKRGLLGGTVVDRFVAYVYAETYNILRVYGGRGSMMFAY
jgi:Major capsid protein N-terminus